MLHELDRKTTERALVIADTQPFDHGPGFDPQRLGAR
jgi:hypothetical protein